MVRWGLASRVPPRALAAAEGEAALQGPPPGGDHRELPHQRRVGVGGQRQLLGQHRMIMVAAEHVAEPGEVPGHGGDPGGEALPREADQVPEVLDLFRQAWRSGVAMLVRARRIAFRPSS